MAFLLVNEGQKLAWLLGMAYFKVNVWTGFSTNYVHALEVLDLQIFRCISGAQAKSPVDML